MFAEAVDQLLQYGRLLQEYDLRFVFSDSDVTNYLLTCFFYSGKQYLATEHIEMSWNCRLIVTGREVWLAWRKAIFGKDRTLFATVKSG